MFPSFWCQSILFSKTSRLARFHFIFPTHPIVNSLAFFSFAYGFSATKRDFNLMGSFVGKVGSFVDKRGNHIEMGLHVFFGCYNNLFRLMKKVNADKNLLVKDHTHTFVNKVGQIGELDFQFLFGVPLHGIRAFLSTYQLKTYDKARNAVALALSPIVRALVDPDGALGDIRNLDSISFSDWFLSKGGTRMSIQRMWDPVAYALGFIDCDNISACCMLTIFSLFATKTEASLLRMLKGSPDMYLSGPIRKYIIDKGGRYYLWNVRTLDEWNSHSLFAILYDKTADGDTYVTGLAMQLRQAAGLDNLLYTPDADFSCFADLALTSPEDYYIEGQENKGKKMAAEVSHVNMLCLDMFWEQHLHPKP
ncbi:zeta-carotene desaturase, chloroplastic/chromoplastic [Fagus crenata]